MGATVHAGGTYVCMEGPAFSTKAESEFYRRWGFDIIGMTNLQEAKLAREAEICYATLALVTDYDCWHPEHDSVTVDMVIDNLQQNAAHGAAGHRARGRACCGTGRYPNDCASALSAAIITHADAIPEHVKRDLAPIIGKYRALSHACRPFTPIHATSTPTTMRIIVTGSIAYDYLMSFPGSFTEHILPEHLSRVSLSFLVDTMDKRRGGCAPNIAYTLALLGERPVLMATAGQDFAEYRHWLEAAWRRHVARARDRRASSARRSSAAATATTTRSRRSTRARWRTPPNLRSPRPGTATSRSSRPMIPRRW